jgi:hypothetical protein
MRGPYEGSGFSFFKGGFDPFEEYGITLRKD